MIIVMKMGATDKEIGSVVTRVENLGFKAHLSKGEEVTIIGLIGDKRKIEPHMLELMDGVDKVVHILKPFKLASRDFKPENTVIPLNGTRIGGQAVTIMAGPCAVEGLQPMLDVAWAIKDAGVHILRGGAYKPRTSPYSFQGLGEEGLESWPRSREVTGLAVVTEVMAPEQVPLVAQYADILQIGARNMQNFALLHAVGEIAQAGAAQARDDVDHRGAADVRRIHPVPRQLPGDPVRARHPHLRDRNPQHAGYQRGTRAEGDDPPAHHRRSQSCHGPVGSGSGYRPRRGRCRRRRAADRSAPRPGTRAFRRRAVPEAGTISPS